MTPPPTSPTVFAPYQCESALDLLNSLDDTVAPSNSVLPFWERGDWIYRGHANADWKLLPSALRTTPPPLLWAEDIGGKSRWSRGVRPTNAAQIRAEANTIRIFFEQADEQGLALPEDSQRLREVLERVSGNDFDAAMQETNGQGWPPTELRSLFALAQHNRVPTRLLDWTRNPLYAAYFAAEQAVRWCQNPPQPDAPLLCVWALSKKAFGLRGERTGTRLQKVTAPAAQNLNLRAQSGLFSLLAQHSKDGTGPTEPTELDHWIRENTPPDHGYMMIQLTLSKWESGKLLRELHRRRVTAATLFPGYGGVAKALDDEQFWGVEPR